MYITVAEVDLDSWLMYVKSSYYSEDLEVLQKGFYTLVLQQLVQSQRERRNSDRELLVFFNDTCIDNPYQDEPLLEQDCSLDTIFISAGYLGQEREFCSDDSLQPCKLPRVSVENLCEEVFKQHLERWFDE